MAAKGGTGAGDRPVPVLGRLLTAAASLSDDRRCRSSVRNAARARRPARGPPPRRRPRPTRRHPPHARQCQRGENRIRRARRRTGPPQAADRGPGLRCQPLALRPARGEHHPDHPRHALAQAPHSARQAALPGSLAHRGRILPPQGLQACRDPRSLPSGRRSWTRGTSSPLSSPSGAAWARTLANALPSLARALPRFVLWGLAIGLVAACLASICITVLGGVISAVLMTVTDGRAPSGPGGLPLGWVITFLIIVPGLVLGNCVTARSSLVFPAIVGSRREVGVQASWRASRGSGRGSPQPI